jgi:sigma-B regulation protein RsbU (phosphoserine phosphatase)
MSGHNRAEEGSVLIVDDLEDKRFILSRILERHHFTVSKAEDGEGALRLLEKEQPDVVLLDVLMPGIDGFEVCRRMKANPQTAEIPVLFITALNQVRSRVQGLELGAEDFITWPVEPSELVARVNARLRSSRLQAHLKTVLAEQHRLLEEVRQRDVNAQAELDKARRIQERFFPATFAHGRSLTFAGHYRPSQKIGGDFFDARTIGESQVALMIVDISGHGVPAALLTGITKAFFHTGMEQCEGPGLFLRWLNKEFSSYLKGGEFLTMFIGIWDAETHTLLYSAAGHPPPLVLSADGTRVDRLEVGGGLLGVSLDPYFPEMSTQLQVGERFILYTDGITEATNPQQDLFGEEGLVSVCARGAGLPLETLVERIFAAVDQFAQGEVQADDQALLAVEVVA